MTWQPIETAPKDGTLVLVCVNSQNFEKPFVYIRGWYPSFGWDGDGAEKVTHWMPLPEPPND